MERGGVIFGRWESAGIERRDDGRSLLVQRVLVADRDSSEAAVSIDYAAVRNLQTIPTTPHHGAPSGRFGADDPGLIIGSIHSHPGLDCQRELSDGDISTAAANSRGAPKALRGRPFLSVIATTSLRWEAGELEDDWLAPQLDFYLVGGDERIVSPRVSMMTELEWTVEESQRALAHAKGEN